MTRAFIGIGIAAMLATSGCRPAVPSAFGDRYADTKDEIQAARYQSEIISNRLNRLGTQPPYSALATRLGTATAKSTAKTALDAAEKLHKEDLRKAANNKDLNAAEAEFARVLGEIEDQLEIAEEALERLDRVFKTVPKLQGSRDVLVAQANQSSVVALASLRAAENAVPPAQKRHPKKREDLDARLAKLRAQVEKVSGSAKMLPLSSDLADMALLYDDAVEGGREAITNGTDIQARVGQLDREYTVTLLDMKADFKASFTRWSWNEQSDFSTEQTYTYPPRLLSPEQYDRLVDVGSQRLGNASLSILGINEYEEMPSGHNRSEIYTDEVSATYYHKLLIAEKGKATETDWVEVTPSAFLRNMENLGMDILYKPVGMYEDEAQPIAAPPGYYMVGNPAYGRWEGSGTNRTWVWLPLFLPRYRSLWLGGPLYYSDWDSWGRSYRGKRSYYGRRRDENNSFGTYVPGGYSGGTYWGSIGGTSRQSATVRGVGSSFRGGGPGGGGK